MTDDNDNPQLPPHLQAVRLTHEDAIEWAVVQLAEFVMNVRTFPQHVRDEIAEHVRNASKASEGLLTSDKAIKPFLAVAADFVAQPAQHHSQHLH